MRSRSSNQVVGSHMYKALSAATAAFMLFGAAQAQNLVNEQVIEAAPRPLTAGAEDVQSFEDWVAANGAALTLKQGSTLDGRTLFAGSSPVRVSPMDPDYGKELAVAYERAWFQLQADFILKEYGRLVTKTVLDVSRDASTNKDEFPEIKPVDQENPTRMGQILDKTLTLMDKRLDKELAEQGVDPESIKIMTLSQKKKIFEDNLTKNIVREAFGSMRGLVPYRTRIFSKRGVNGVVNIVGIVGVQSEKTQQFARDIAMQRASAVRGTPKRIEDLLPENSSDYLDQVGLRFAYDESGRPMLISFGRWALNENKNWSPARYERELQIAKGTAEVIAQSWIVEFTSFRVTASSSDDIGSVQAEIVEQISSISNGSTSTETVRRDIGATIDKSFKKARGSATGKMAGMSTLKTWEQRDANGVMHVGTVVTWTQAQLDSVKSRSRMPESRRPSRGPSASFEDRSSRIINSEDDF